MPNVMKRRISIPLNKSRLSRTQLFSVRPCRNDVYKVMSVSYSMCHSSSSSSFSSALESEMWTAELVVSLCCDAEEDIELRSSRLRSDSLRTTVLLLAAEPILSRGVRTYLMHSSLSSSSTTKPLISAVGAYIAPKLKISRSTRHP